jgi:hypothetical protein|nr:MAG TPA: tail tubular protein [Caudoviricetes sp.]
MTLTDIANIALEDLGEKPINSIDGEDSVARKVKRKIFLTVETVCARRNWVCLRKEIELTRKVFDGEGEYAYNRPNGLLSIIESNAPYTQAGDTIYSPSESLRIKCTVKSYRPNDWDVLLRNSIIAQLKYDIALSISGNADVASQMFQLANMEIRRNMLNDAYNEKNRIVQKESDWFSEI